MPLFLEPDLTFPVVLDCDADKPQDIQPTFLARVQPMRGQLKIGRVIDLWHEQKDITTEQLFDAHIDVLKEVLVGWRNMGGHEFTEESLRSVLLFNEARELLRKVMYNQHITPEEKKS